MSRRMERAAAIGERHRERQRARSSVAGDYLQQSLEALRDALSPDALWAQEVDDLHRDSILAPLQENINAQQRRFMFLRTSVLFAALSAEAHANQFLFLILSPDEIKPLDRQSTVRKILAAGERAGELNPFASGREPLQTIGQLFRARDALVHPRPRTAFSDLLHISDDDRERFGPEAAGRYIEAVAHAVHLLRELLELRSTFGATGSNVYRWRAVLRAHVAAFPDDLRVLPGRDDPPVRDLLNQMQAEALKGHTPRPSHEVREAVRSRPRGPLPLYRPPE